MYCCRKRKVYMTKILIFFSLYHSLQILAKNMKVEYKYM